MDELNSPQELCLQPSDTSYPIQDNPDDDQRSQTMRGSQNRAAATFDDAFCHALQELLMHGQEIEPITNPTSPHSDFGKTIANKLLELQGWSATVDPGYPLLRNSVRRAWIDQALGMALWNLMGSDELAIVQFYNPNAERFSDDGLKIRAPWGHRMLSPRHGARLTKALEALTSDPSTMRAVIPVFEAHDLGVSSRDVPCLTHLQLFCRSGQLDFFCHLRALNPYWIWSYDHFFLSLLNAICAKQLNLKNGCIHYMANSMHIRACDRALVERSIAAHRSLSVTVPADASHGCSLLDIPEYLTIGKLEDLPPIEKRFREIGANAIATLNFSPMLSFLGELQGDWERRFFEALALAIIKRHAPTSSLLADAPLWLFAEVAD